MRGLLALPVTHAARPPLNSHALDATPASLAEFVGCSPSLSGALRVNPWSIESVADAMFAAVRMPLEHRRLRHDKHWRYVSQHTVAYWSASYIADLTVSAWAHGRGLVGLGFAGRARLPSCQGGAGPG